MTYHELQPSQQLKPFVKCYFLFESEPETEFEDTVFPGGHMEIIFNLGNAFWQSWQGETFSTTPKVELWGQLTTPLKVRTKGSNTMLGIRFHAHAASLILREDVLTFNNKISNLEDILGNASKHLHQRLLETSATPERILLLENFLLNRLAIQESKGSTSRVVDRIIAEMATINFSERVESIAARYGITSRYLQKLFLQHTGITPKTYCKINRFQYSLKQLSNKESSLAAVAHDSGYFDQSHFIREFKAFTGITPSAYSSLASPLNAALVG